MAIAVAGRKRTVVGSAADNGGGGDFGFLGRYYCCYCWRMNRTNLPRRRRGRLMMMLLLLLRLMMMMKTVTKVVVERVGY